MVTSLSARGSRLASDSYSQVDHRARDASGPGRDKTELVAEIVRLVKTSLGGIFARDLPGLVISSQVTGNSASLLDESSNSSLSPTLTRTAGRIMMVGA